jgi:GntR family transcriptional regulator/MocR family aminotransferase
MVAWLIAVLLCLALRCIERYGASGALIRSGSVAIEWTGLGPELLLRLDRELREPLGSQLQRELRESIRSGRLSAGERLPSSRVLARELDVSRGLVLECYSQLEAEGYLSTRVGSATRVAVHAATAPAPASRVPPPERLTVDFRYGVPDLTSFPMRDWLWAVGEAGRAAPSAAAGYGDPRGSAVLREVLAGYLRRVRGTAADPERMVVCTGFAQGANLVLRALALAGVRTVAIEDPGDRDNDLIAERAGLAAVPVPVDERGVDVAALAATGARAVVLTPAHQTPTGVVLAPERRQELTRWADEADGYLVEDDYDAEFRYDRQPVGSLQGLAPHRVVAMGSVSKSLAPAMRLGWIHCPERLIEAVANEKHLADRGSPGLDQLALALLIESGRYDRHLRRMRGVYATRREALVDALARHAADVELSGLAAGFHAVARLPAAADERAIVAAARQRSVGLYGMSGYRHDGGTQPPELVIGFGNVTESSIRQGIATVADLLSAEPSGRPGGRS